MTTRAEADANRLPGCPNFGTRRTCGKAYNSGCRHDMCVIPYNEKKAAKLREKTGGVKRETKPVGPRSVFVGGFPAKDQGHSENWVLHDKCCSGSRVWRHKSLGCLPTP